MDTYWKKRFG